MAIRYGDANLDGFVNIRDVLLVQRYIANLETLDDNQKRAADVNGDEVINNDDVSLIQQYCSELITIFPVEI